MIRPDRLAALALLVWAPMPVFAQARVDPVRLDDFAVAQGAHDSSRVEQVGPGGEPPAEEPQSHDRVIAVPPPREPATRLPQLSTQGQRPDPPQLSKPGAAPDETRAAVSSTADSRPQGVIRLGGQDRCDPQLAREELDRCRRILELRAREFSAPAPPKLSAEQALLAEQRGDDRQLTGPTPETRLRLASRDEPDADLQSNQEVAALYLRGQKNPPDTAAQREDEQAAVSDASLAQILNALQSQAGAAAPPP